MGFLKALGRLIGGGERRSPPIRDDGQRPRPAAPKRSWLSAVAGESYRNRDGSSRQKIIAQCRIGEGVRLVREPDNPHDRNAIFVCRENGQGIGYIPADSSFRMADEIDRGWVYAAEIAEITGGVGGKRSLGVVLKISVVSQARR